MKKFTPKSPDPYLNEEADMSLAKFGHINALVDAVTLSEDNVSTNTADIATNAADIAAITAPTKKTIAFFFQQLNADTPVYTEMYNDTGQTIIPSRSAAGTYSFTLSGTTLFTVTAPAVVHVTAGETSKQLTSRITGNNTITTYNCTVGTTTTVDYNSPQKSYCTIDIYL